MSSQSRGWGYCYSCYSAAVSRGRCRPSRRWGCGSSFARRFWRRLAIARGGAPVVRRSVPYRADGRSGRRNSPCRARAPIRRGGEAYLCGRPVALRGRRGGVASEGGSVVSPSPPTGGGACARRCTGRKSHACPLPSGNSGRAHLSGSVAGRRVVGWALTLWRAKT